MVRAWPEIAHTTHTPRHIFWGPLPPLPLSLLVCKMAQEHWLLITLEGREEWKNLIVVFLKKYLNYFCLGVSLVLRFFFRYNVTWNMSWSPELSEPTRTLEMQPSELKI